MGNLLGAPVTEKETCFGSTDSQGLVRFAVSSMQGWRVHMEDAHIAEDRLYATTPQSKIDLPGHALFAVFDGHGGSYSAMYSGRNLCRVLSKQDKFVKYAQLYTSGNVSSNKDQLTELLKGALTDAFVDLDREIACALKGQKVADADQPYQGGESSDATSSNDKTDPMTGVEVTNEDASAEAKNAATTTQDALQLLEDEGDSGTTACVVFLSPEFVVCANAGDSRSCLRKLTGQTIPLSYDHKPDDESEERRIRAAGGYVAGGRVEGDLAVSRGLGDFRFKQMDIVLQGVVPEGGPKAQENGQEGEEANPSGIVTVAGDQKVSPIPDVMVYDRDLQQDAFCIIACDGIWDVQTNEHATKLVTDLFSEGESDIGLLCEEVCDNCLRLGSKDNMTVLIMQFPAQSVSSTGGGVTGRRQIREAESSASQAKVTNMSS